MTRTVTANNLLLALLIATGLIPSPKAAAAVTFALSVMSYNVHGLPWPLATGRDEAFTKIAARLQLMRKRQTHPHVIILQEAFTDAAKQIARRGGYHYIVNGPSEGLVDAGLPSAADANFVSAASFFKGETSGKLLDSGLLLASDYPIISVKRAAFPAFACAGFDCLANKGILLVTIAVPGSNVPVTVATTHMNSKRSSGVSQERSLYAYRRQLEALDHFIADNRNPNFPIIVAGDFNASSPPRRASLVNHGTANWTTPYHLPINSALQHCLSPMRPCGGALAAIAFNVYTKGRDWQFYTSGLRSSIEAVKFNIPFGPEQDGTMLSDHVGYDVVYRLTQVTKPNAIRYATAMRKRVGGMSGTRTFVNDKI
jgi:endonuclease/exonuclease/phosphatase family metal-dependent hydrolase